MPVSINPASGETVKAIASHDSDAVQRALANAQAAFEEWKGVSFEKRAKLMNEAARILDEKREELARLATLEMGKRIAEARAEVEKCAWVCRYYAENAEAFLSDDPRESGASKSYVRYQPLGVVMAVMPWNFPYWQVFRFAAPTLMAGNVGLLKHASNVPQCSMAIEEVFVEAGFPQGVFASLIIGSDKVAAIVEDERVKAVTLTGSEGAGRSIAKLAGEQVKPCVLELGGSDPFIVMPSADLDKAVETAVKARMINNGQSCIAAKRFIVQKDIYDDFATRFADKIRALKLGDPMDEDTGMGPLSSKDARDDIADQVKEAVNQGATLVTGGKAVDRDGFFFEPALLTDFPQDSIARKEEFFGPVALLFKADDAADAIAIANETTFGLGSSAWTNDADEMDMFIDAIGSGCVFINQMVASDPRLPFGGIGVSGFGRELSKEGIHAFVNIKTVSIA